MKSIKLLKNCTKKTINSGCNSEIKVLKNLLDMEMHGVQELPALFFDNLQNALKKLFWKYMKFSTIIDYTTYSTTRKIFTMNYLPEI